MPKKNSALLHKVSNLMKIAIFLAKLKRPMTQKLEILEKMRKLKKLKLIKQYNYYSYVEGYEFSPWSTPLIQFRRKARNGRISFKKLYSKMLFISRCLGMERCGGKKEMHWLEPLPCSEPAALGRELSIDLSNSWSEDESVDERAERFIRMFCEEMRRQRLESCFQLNAMLEM